MTSDAFKIMEPVDHEIIPQLHHGSDGDVLLVAIAKELESGSVQEAAQTLLQDKFKVNAVTTLLK